MRTKSLQRKRAMRTALLVLLLSAVGMGKGYAYDFEVDGVYYNITSSSNPRTVEVTYRNENYNCYSGEIEIPSTITHNGNTYTVTRIGNKAFYSFNYHEITSIILPNSIIEIGGYAFDGCDRITSMLIPNSVTIIEGGAFTCCYGLTSITIPESVETIGGVAFQFCDHLETINYNAINCTTIGAYNSFQSLPAFAGCTAVTILNIGEDVQKIPSKAFNGCTALATVNFNAINCTVDGCFNDCTNLSTLNYCDGVEHIDAKNIIGFQNLTTISIPNSVKSIDFINVAYGHAIPDNGCFYGTGWFDNQPNGVLYLDGWCLGYKGNPPIGNLTIQDGTKGICNHAFRNTEIGAIIIPFSLNYLGIASFDNCKNLRNISIPNNVISIGELAFAGCNQIVSVSLGSSITTIGDYAFINCSNLNTILLLNPTPPVLGCNVFQNISPVATIFVPCGSQLAYFSNWNIFEYNNIHEDCNNRSISIDANITGGTVTSSVTEASMGQVVQLTVTPNSGLVLSSITVHNASDPAQIIPITPLGKTSSIYSFVMPPYAVKVSATFNYTSVDENKASWVAIYPNPTDGRVTIEADDLKHITICNMLGQIIYEDNASGNEFVYDFGQHGEGVYLIRIETTNGIVTKRVAVTK